MKITEVETFLVPPRWLFCRVGTDAGLVGWGEPVVEGRAETVRAGVDELTDLLVGSDPRRIEDLWQTMTKAAFYRGGPVLSSAVAGIDQALWDILGRSLGVPVYQLLGGAVRDRVRVYGWIGGDEPSEVADAAAERAEAGLTAVKMNASGRIGRMPTAAETAGVVDRLAAVREVMGEDRDIAVDFHGRFTAAAARRVIPELAPLHPLFVEEPVLPEYTHRLGDLVAVSPVPVATGERLFSRTDFLPALRAGVAVVQPDLSHAGGVSEVRRIAALAETFDALLAPHCPLGPIA
ncbi:MAG: galactonate dehydratase, partial [Pseudonocardia sp.]|nr:galactonate dehydratase [Pseudonocardia sp.]